MCLKYMKKLWHYDDTRPVSHFNLIDENEQYKCNNWINIRLYVASKNISINNKSDSFAEM